MMKSVYQTVDSGDQLKDRVNRMFRGIDKRRRTYGQLPLDLPPVRVPKKIEVPRGNISNFLDFLSAAMPDGDVYLFGGILRDLAIFGRRGFNSDIDLVVKGDWENIRLYLEHLKAHRNKFGGYRLQIGEWPVDIWNAEETWAIKEGFVKFQGIESLLDTTVLNWDSILLNWRTKSLIYKKQYFENINNRSMDIVLLQNPNPKGMAVRVFRHFCLKDAAKISTYVAEYLADCAKIYSYEELHLAELKSYGKSGINYAVYNFFSNMDVSMNRDIKHEFSIASSIVCQELNFSESVQNSVSE